MNTETLESLKQELEAVLRERQHFDSIKKSAIKDIIDNIQNLINVQNTSKIWQKYKSFDEIDLADIRYYILTRKTLIESEDQDCDIEETINYINGKLRTLIF